MSRRWGTRRLAVVLVCACALAGCATGTGGGAVPDRATWDASPPELVSPGRSCEELQAPAIVKSVAPVYSPELRRNRVQGDVLVTLVVDATGEPHDPVVVRAADGELARACTAALLESRFAPALCDGEPVRVMIRTSCAFRITSH